MIFKDWWELEAVSRLDASYPRMEALDINIYYHLCQDAYNLCKSNNCKDCADYDSNEEACYSDEVSIYREIKLSDVSETFGCNKFRRKL